jgi:hypothetical protein
MPSDTQAVLQLLSELHNIDDDTLSKRIQDNFCGSLLSLSQLKTPVQEVLRRFKCLLRKKSMDGRYPTISGYRSFGAGKIDKVGWCQGVLGRSDRAVRYMLAGGNKRKEKISVLRLKAPKESSPDAQAFARKEAYFWNDFEDYINTLTSEQRKMFAQKLLQAAAQLEKESENV